MKTGVIVGRFQVPFLHDGHRELIEKVCQENDKVIIFIGCATETKTGRLIKDEKNPFSSAFRSELISVTFPHFKNKIVFKTIMDVDSDLLWSINLNTVIHSEVNPNFIKNVTLYGSRDCFLKSYLGPLPGKCIDTVGEFSGTEIRNKYLYKK